MRRKRISGSGSQLLPWIEQFVYSLPHLKRATRQEYRNVILDFTLYMDKISGKKIFLLANVKQSMIIKWLRELKAKQSSLSQVLNRTWILDRFFSFLEKKGRLKKNPLDPLRKKYTKRGLKGIVLALVGSSPQKSLRALKMSSKFTSPLGVHMKKYISLGRAQGKLYIEEERVLCQLDHLLRSYSDPPDRLSDLILIKWLGMFAKCSSRYRCQNFYVFHRFCLYLRRFDSTAYVPAPSLTPRFRSGFVPHIYSRGDIVAIVKAAHKLKPTVNTLRPHMYYVLILLLYTTGMRVSEVVKFQLRDIDHSEQMLYIRKTKFFKARAVPLSSSMMKELEDFLERRRKYGISNSPKSYLFHNPYRRKHYAITGIEATFISILRGLKLKPPPECGGGPRLHDLRATFAVHRLEEWYRQGVDVQSQLGRISTYLGHANISGTQPYLPMTPELLGGASQLFEKYFNSAKGEKKDEK